MNAFGCLGFAPSTSSPQTNEASGAVAHFAATFKGPTNALADPAIPIRTPIDFKFILHEWRVTINLSVCVKRTVVDHYLLKATDANYK